MYVHSGLTGVRWLVLINVWAYGPVAGLCSRFAKFIDWCWRKWGGSCCARNRALRRVTRGTEPTCWVRSLQSFGASPASSRRRRRSPRPHRHRISTYTRTIDRFIHNVLKYSHPKTNRPFRCYTVNVKPICFLRDTNYFYKHFLNIKRTLWNIFLTVLFYKSFVISE